jgi:hypothetical protein
MISVWTVSVTSSPASEVERAAIAAQSSAATSGVHPAHATHGGRKWIVLTGVTASSDRCGCPSLGPSATTTPSG